jgi:UMF1 family MFS transporter
MYVVGAYGLWWAAPGDFNLIATLVLFAIGLIGMEFATIFTNAMLPTLGKRRHLGRISGSGFAWGYVGGLVSLILMLFFFAENAETGKTLLGMDPVFGLDAEAREGTRAVGPLTAIWFAVGMIPFFLWVRDEKLPGAIPMGAALRGAWPSLNGMYVFGGIYASGVLGWSIVDVGIFGILAILTGAFFSWLGGRMDGAFGPKPVIVLNVVVLSFVALAVVFVSRDSVFGIPVEETSRAPDIAFYILGAFIGACGGALQSASRTMLVRQAYPDRMTEAFGLYALAGKATSFIAPLSIGVMTQISGSQQIGVVPLVILFLIGLILLFWVDPKGRDYEGEDA